MSRVSHIAFLAVAVCVALWAVALAARGTVQNASFKAFYCGGYVARQRADPYRVEPLRRCEHRVARMARSGESVEPAPLPPFDLTPFALLSLLEIHPAALLFSLISAAASIWAALMLGALLRTPPAAVLMALAPLVMLNVAYGETAPIALAAIVGAGYAARAGKWQIAAVAAVCALIQPNVGALILVALAVFAPKTRAALLIGVAALATIGVLTVGPHVSIEYFTDVLPRQAASEVAAADQYSATHLLYLAGTSAADALATGRAISIMLALIGIVVAGAAFKRTERAELLAFIPPSFMLFLGAYVHDIQVLLALPFALVFVTSTSGSLRFAALFALLCLVEVWTQVPGRTVIALNVLGTIGAMGVALPGTWRARDFGFAVLAGVVTIACVSAVQRVEMPAPGLVTARQQTTAGNEFAAVAWERYIESSPALTRRVIVREIPTLVGLLVLCLGASFMRGRCVSREPLLATVP